MRQRCSSGVQSLGAAWGGSCQSTQRHKIDNLGETLSAISYAAGHLQGRLARLTDDERDHRQRPGLLVARGPRSPTLGHKA